MISLPRSWRWRFARIPTPGGRAGHAYASSAPGSPGLRYAHRIPTAGTAEWAQVAMGGVAPQEAMPAQRAQEGLGTTNTPPQVDEVVGLEVGYH